MKSRTAMVLLASIRRDGGTQIRAALDESTVAEYTAAIKAGVELPPVDLYFDGTDHWLPDGFHRVEANLRCGRLRIDAVVTRGTQRDAIMFACGSNADHGLRRSNADKHRAVEMLLADPEWGEWSDRRIAKAANVSHTLVAELRETLNDRSRKSGNIAKHTPLSHMDSKPGQPTAGLTPPANPALEGDDETGQNPDLGQAPAPVSSIDLLGINGIDPAWLELAENVVVALDAFDGYLQSAQARLTPLLTHEAVGVHLQVLRQSAHALAARARLSARPRSVCAYCKDPDGEGGRREECNGCHGLGWLAGEQLTAVPRELLVRGAGARVIDQRAGGYVPRELEIERDDEDEDRAF